MKLHIARSDLEGGIIATLFALPIELVYGRIAVAPLGPLHFSNGIQAALWTCVLTGFLATLFRGTPGVINGSGAKIALILAALVAALMRHPDIMASPDPAELVFVLLFVCTATAGVLQCLFALMKFSKTLKFIPYPVIAGTMIGSAVLMTKTAVLTTVGAANLGASTSFLAAWHPWSILVAATTFLFCLKPPGILRQTPFMLSALIAGTLVHYVLAIILGAGHLGNTWSGVDGLLPPFSIWHFTQAEGVRPLFHWLPMVFPYALAIAAVASLESMLCLPAVEAATLRKPDSNRELLSQGLSNLVAGLLGGFPSEAVTSRSIANLRAGGRSRFSGVFYSVGLALLVLFGSQWLGLVPEAVTAGLVLYLAYTLIDDGTRRLVRQLASRHPNMPRFQYRMLWANALVLLIVALVAIVGDMLKATGVGVVLGMMLFILTSMKPVIRTMATGQNRRSLKVRTPAAAALLEKEGARIQIAELEGILFFGTAERVALEIGALPESVRIMVLDFGRVREIDATAARTLLQLARRVQGRGQRLFLCGSIPSVEADLTIAGLHELVPPQQWFDDGDQALEAAEESLLEELHFQRADMTLPLAQTMLANGLEPPEVDVLASYLEHRTLDAGSVLFQQGDRGDSLFVAADGVIDICLPLRNGRKQRVASFAPGVIVGEMAFIEQQPRSAAGHLESATQLWELTRARFDTLAVDHPMLAHRVMMNLSRGLSQRLRTTTQSLRAASAAGDFVVRSGVLAAGAIERRRQPA